jgi:hypothetical protein
VFDVGRIVVEYGHISLQHVNNIKNTSLQQKQNLTQFATSGIPKQNKPPSSTLEILSTPI